LLAIILLAVWKQSINQGMTLENELNYISQPCLLVSGSCSIIESKIQFCHTSYHSVKDLRGIGLEISEQTLENKLEYSKVFIFFSK